MGLEWGESSATRDSPGHIPVVDSMKEEDQVVFPNAQRAKRLVLRSPSGLERPSPIDFGGNLTGSL